MSRAIDADRIGLIANDSSAGATNRARIIAWMLSWNDAYGGGTFGARGGELVFGPGVWDWSDYVPIFQQCAIRGSGVATYGRLAQTIWRFPKTKDGVRFENAYGAGAGVSSGSNGASLSGIGVYSQSASQQAAGGGAFHPRWSPDKVTTVGSVVTNATLPLTTLGSYGTRPYSWGWAYVCTAVTGNARTGLVEPAWAWTCALSATPVVETTGSGSVTWQPIDAQGIKVYQSDIKIRDVEISGFPGNGVVFRSPIAEDGDVTGTPLYQSNSDLSSYSGGTINQCGGSGVFLIGGDSGVIRVSDVNFNSNRKFGINEFPGSAGNHYDKCHFADNAHGHMYSVGGNFTRNYVEGNFPPAYLGPAAAIDYAFFDQLGGTQTVLTGHYATGLPVDWTADTVTTVGTIMRPATPNGFLYYCYFVTGDAKTGASEPAYALADDHVSSPNEQAFSDGNVGWITYGYDVVSTGTWGSSADNNSQRTFSDLRYAKKLYFHAGVNTGNNGAAVFGWSIDSETFHVEDTSNGSEFTQVGSARGAFGVSKASFGAGAGWMIKSTGASYELSRSTAPATPAGSWIGYFTRFGRPWMIDSSAVETPIATERNIRLVGNADVAAATVQEHIVFNVALTANHTVLLPGLSSVSDGFTFPVSDFTLTAANAILVGPTGTDKINGSNTTQTLITCAVVPSRKNITKISNSIGWLFT